MLGGKLIMFEDKTQCPFCAKCIGVFNSSENSEAIILKEKPIEKLGKKQKYFETKCPRCKKLLYIQIGFKD